MIGLNYQKLIVNGLLHLCSIMNHKWIDLVLPNIFKWIKREKRKIN